MSELQLFEMPAEPKLTDRQQRALDAIRGAGWDGLTSDEIGAILHYPKHTIHDLCEWCGSAGLEVARALRSKGLVQQRRRQAPGRDVYMVWVVAGTSQKRPAETTPFEFPDGF